MYLFTCCLLLFLLVFFLICGFHLFIWNITVSGASKGFRSWVSPFECGFVSGGIVENYFSHTYFVLLVFFVVFDLEVSLLLKMPLQGILFKNLGYYLFFLFLLSWGFLMEVDKGYVEWGY
uniref:NADH dehydrogenase subunit 3 n=1 Tax=Creptotrematina aguirrepequenoi TaxID=985756 RepID=UPI003002B006|nr:NADH dehydrogenase subunit 3 [Creptotrematina aguirrepequenoi]